MKTVIHNYSFDIRTEQGKADWLALKAKLEAEGLRVFETHGGGSHCKPQLGTREIELETKHLFDNQWNTAPIEGVSDKGLRVFDWALDYNSHSGAPHGIKRGHWLEQTPAMREIRRNTYACGYCGKQEPAQKGDVFCSHCLDSEHLKESELHLTRMKAIDDKAERAPLTEAERAHLLPKYREAQLHGSTERGKARIAAQREAVHTKFKNAVANATAERDGFVWLMDHGVNTSNVIYYSHTKRFSFGWRAPISKAVESELLDIITEFPFSYDIRCEDGRILSGER